MIRNTFPSGGPPSAPGTVAVVVRLTPAAARAEADTGPAAQLTASKEPRTTMRIRLLMPASLSRPSALSAHPSSAGNRRDVKGELGDGGQHSNGKSARLASRIRFRVALDAEVDDGGDRAASVWALGGCRHRPEHRPGPRQPPPAPPHPRLDLPV